MEVSYHSPIPQNLQVVRRQSPCFASGSMAIFPSEIVQIIFSHLATSDKNAFSATSKSNQKISNWFTYHYKAKAEKDGLGLTVVLLKGILSQLPNLTSLGYHVVLSDDILKMCLRLQIVTPNYLITDDSLKTLTNLRSLNAIYNYKITDVGLQTLTNLTSLHFGRNKEITDVTLKTLTNLTSLRLGSYCTITDEGLKTLTNLTILDLRSNRTITVVGLKTLTNLDLTFNNKITKNNLTLIEVNLMRIALKSRTMTKSKYH